MSTAPVSVVPEQAPSALSGEVLTRRAVTAVAAAVMVITFAFSLGNVTRLCLDLGITVWIAWLVGPAVDLSVIGLLVGIRFLSLHGYKDDELAGLRRMLRFCGLLTLALNTAGAIGHHQYGTALVDAVGPALLIGWSEVGPWLLHQIFAVCQATAPEPSAPRNPEAVQRPAAALPARQLARTRELDAEHRAATGRPISRDALRARLQIGRDRAGDLVRAVRAEAAAAAGPRAAAASRPNPAHRRRRVLLMTLLTGRDKRRGRAAGVVRCSFPGFPGLASHAIPPVFLPEYLTMIYHGDIGTAALSA